MTFCVVTDWHNRSLSNAFFIMVTLTRTTADDGDFQQLVVALDSDLARRDGREHGFYAQYNRLEGIRYAVVAYEDTKPVGCGAIKQFSQTAMEVKRMFVTADQRGRGIASQVLQELEAWAKELGFEKCVLETGKRQPEAIQLYLKNQYTVIPNYGQYAGVENSVCFEKILV